MSVYRPGEDPNFHAVFERADTLMYEEKQGLILVSIKKLEKLFIAPKARLRLHETA